jgi:hypothetical protein
MIAEGTLERVAAPAARCSRLLGSGTVNRRQWTLELDGRRCTVELEHRTWWHRAIVAVDGRVEADRSINLALGYDRAVDLTADIDGHRMEVAIRADWAIRPTYRYALLVDGSAVPGSDVVEPGPRVSNRPSLIGVVEAIVWASMAVAAARTLSNGHPERAVLLLPAAVLASVLLRGESVPVSWRVVGAVLVVVAWIAAIVLLTGVYDPPRGV